MKKLLFFFLLLPFFGRGQVITTVVGTGDGASTGIGGYSGDNGPAIFAELYGPAGVIKDRYGNILFADGGNRCVRKVNTLGIISTIAGGSGSGLSGDNGPATAAAMLAPRDIAIDQIGNIYVADADRHNIRKIDTLGIITTIAGNDTFGYSGDNGPATAAKLWQPNGIAIGAFGDLYISDGGRNVIRKVSTSGIITTIAGDSTAGYSGDGGPATAAKLNSPCGITVDGNGNIYFADDVNHRVRKIDPGGIITTIAGRGINGNSGDGGPATSAELSFPLGVSLDAHKNIYITDCHAVRKIDTSGIIWAVAGSGICGYSGNGGDPTLAQLCVPNSAYVDVTGNVYIGDGNNNCIRLIIMDSIPNAINSVNNIDRDVSIYPNPVCRQLNVLSAVDKIHCVAIVNLLGEQVYIGHYSNKQVEVNVTTLPKGMYFVRINDIAVRRFVKE